MYRYIYEWLICVDVLSLCRILRFSNDILEMAERLNLEALFTLTTTSDATFWTLTNRYVHVKPRFKDIDI